jgi:hypothetical protein
MAAGNTLTMKDARAILAKHAPPKKKPTAKPGTLRAFTTPAGPLSIRLDTPDATTSELAQALAAALRELQAERERQTAPSEPDRGMFGFRRAG